MNMLDGIRALQVRPNMKKASYVSPEAYTALRKRRNAIRRCLKELGPSTNEAVCKALGLKEGACWGDIRAMEESGAIISMQRGKATYYRLAVSPQQE